MFPGAGTVYRLMYLVGFAIMMVVNLKTYKRYRFTTKNTVIITLITYVAGVLGAMIMGKIYSFVMNYKGLPGSTTVAIFGAVIFTPIFMTAASLILKQDWRRVLDMLAPGIFIILACAKFGCFLSGCCHGIECSFGVMSPRINVTVFPVQIVEVFFMCLIIVFCFRYSLKSKCYVKGAVYPATTIIYCFMRFFIENLRYYEAEGQRNILFGMTMWQLCCVGVSLVCTVWLIILHTKKVKKLDAISLARETEEDIQLEKRIRKEKAKKRKEKARKKKK